MSVVPSPDQLVARQAIVELRHRYCHLADAHEYDAWADLFTEDAVIDAEGREVQRGREEILAFAHEVLDEEYVYSAHIVANPVIDVDGDEGTGEWYVYLTYDLSDGRSGWKQGQYHERYRLTDEGWKFARVEATFHAGRTYETLRGH